MPRPGPRTVPQAERRELIRRLLVAGVPEWQIRRDIARGVRLEDGRTVQVGSETLRRDLEELGLEWRALHDNPQVVERVVGAALERLVRIADAAERAGSFHAAIRANQVIVDLLGRRSPRWARRPDESPAISAGARKPYAELSDEELQRELAARRERTERLGLHVVAGGAGAA